MNLNPDKIDHSTLAPRVRRLSNGKPVYLFAGDSAELVKLDLTFEAGTAYQPKKLVAGTANQLFTEGTLRHSAREIAEFMDFRGIAVDKNIDTYTATVSFYALRKHLPELLPVVRELVTEPAFPQQEFDVYVAKQRQSLNANMQNTSYVARNLFYESLYGFDHPMGGYAVDADFDRIANADVVRFYNERYRLPEARITLAGAVADEEVMADLDRCFGQDPYSPAFDVLGADFRPVAPVTDLSPVRSVLPSAVQSTIRMGCLVPFAWDSVEYAWFQVLSTVLGGYFGSRLMSNVREDKGYTYGIQSQTKISRGSVVFYLTTDVGAEVTDAAVAEIWREMDRLVSEPVLDDELERVRDVMMGDFLRSIDGIFEQSERYRQMSATHCSEVFDNNYFEAVRSVTPRQLQSLARRMFRRDGILQVVVGPER